MIDWQVGPRNRWAFQKVDELVPTVEILRGAGEVAPLIRNLPRFQADPEKRLARLTSMAPFGLGEMLIDELESTFTDALLVVRDDDLIVEHYENGMTPATRHLAMSVSKLFVGMLIGQAIEDGFMREEDLVSHILPELRGAGFGSATIGHLLDMTAAVQFSEEYADPSSEAQRHDRVAGWRDREEKDPQDTYEFLQMLQGEKEHGRAFQYCSAGTDVLAWALERTFGVSYTVLLQEKIWEKLGVAFDAYITVDPSGFAAANGGLCLTARDLAVFGKAILEGSVPVPRRWLATKLSSDRATVSTRYLSEIAPGLSYRGHFWLLGDQNGCYMGWGIFGQYLFVDPTNNVVIVKFSSEPVADSLSSRRRHLSMFSDIVEILKRS